MSLLRDIGRFAGKGAGFVMGGPIQLVGELTGVELLEDIGKGVRKASEFAGDTAGQVVSGAVNTVSGMINEDTEKRDKGLGDIGSAVTRTAKGVVVTAKNTFQNGGEVIGGVLDGDHEKIKKGATSLVKTVAIGAIAVGVVDIIDGAEVADASELEMEENSVSESVSSGEDSIIETTNDQLVGSVHPETNVPFIENTVELPNGQHVTGVFPSFDVEHEVHLDESLYLQSDYVQFSYANQELYDAIQDNPDLAEDLGLSQQDVQGLESGETPKGYTWHHHEEPGVLQLVDQESHANTGHTGGREIWGGGESNR